MATDQPTTDPSTVKLPDDENHIPDDPPQIHPDHAKGFPQADDTSLQKGVVYEGRVNNVTDNEVFVSFAEPWGASNLTGMMPKNRMAAKGHLVGDIVYATPFKFNSKGPLLQGVEVTTQAPATPEPIDDGMTPTEEAAAADAVEALTDDLDDSISVDESEEATESDTKPDQPDVNGGVPVGYACPYCRDDGRYTDTVESNVRRHITKVTDSRHRDKSGSDPGTYILLIDADGNEIERADAGELAETTREQGEITTTLGDITMSDTPTDDSTDTTTQAFDNKRGNASYKGPALDMRDQYLSERPVKSTAGMGDDETADMGWDDIDIPTPIKAVAFDALPDENNAENYRKVLTVLADYLVTNPDSPGMKVSDLIGLPTFDRSRAWAGARMKELAEDTDFVVREQQKPGKRQPYYYQITDDALLDAFEEAVEEAEAEAEAAADAEAEALDAIEEGMEERDYEEVDPDDYTEAGAAADAEADADVAVEIEAVGEALDQYIEDRVWVPEAALAQLGGEAAALKQSGQHASSGEMQAYADGIRRALDVVRAQVAAADDETDD